MNSKKQYALDIIQDLLSNYFYYDREDDDELTTEQMNELITSGKLTADEIVKEFSDKIRDIINANYKPVGC